MNEHLDSTSFMCFRFCAGLAVLLIAIACRPARSNKDGEIELSVNSAGIELGTPDPYGWEVTAKWESISEPIHLEGIGQVGFAPIRIEFPHAVITFNYSGNEAVIVKASFSDGSDEVIVDTIGPYSGDVLLKSPETVVLEVEGKEPWTLKIAPAEQTHLASFRGTGDDVSGLFSPPESGPWEITHDGTREFTVRQVCHDGTKLAVEGIGSVSKTDTITFGRGPCLWSVRADGEWSLTPRP